jgi:hypothetical protein
MQYWLLFFDTWDLIGAFSYTVTFALLESVIILFALVTLATILPRRLLRDRFVAHATAIVLLTAVWVIADQLRLIRFVGSPFWPFLYLVSMAILYLLICRYQILQGAIDSFAERLTVLLYLYVPVAFLGLLVVIVRNLGSS